MKPDISARIEWLGKLNDRRLKANEAGDIAELERVAVEYELLKRPCMVMAREIRIAISVRERQNNHEKEIYPDQPQQSTSYPQG